MKTFLLAVVTLLSAHVALVPKACSAQVPDSIAASFLTRSALQTTALDSARRQDSLYRAKLEAEIGSLRAADSTKKTEMLREIAQLQSNDSLRLAQKRGRIDSLRASIKGFAVVPFFHDTLFFIYNKLGSLTAEQRAETISSRITSLAEDFAFQPDSLAITPSESTSDISFGQTIIISISDYDAMWQDTTRVALARRYKADIVAAILAYRKATSWETIAKQIGFAAMVIAILAALIFFTMKLFRYTKAAIARQKNTRIKPIRLANYEFINAERQLEFLLAGNTILKWVVILSLIYISLPIVFGIFPWTHGFAGVLISYVVTPLRSIAKSIWGYLPKLFAIIVIVTVFRYALKALRFLMNEVERGALHIPGFYADWAKPTFQIVRVLIYAFMLVVIFPYLPGSDSPIFQGVSVFLGVVFTFSSSGSLSNIVAGLVLTYMRAFKIGDRVKIGGVTGDIVEKTLLVTRIRTIKNEIVSLPNSSVMNSHTVNYSSAALETGLILHTTVTIGYGVPWRDMHRALLAAAGRTESLLKDPAPFVLQTSLDDFYVSYQINAYTREPNLQAPIYSELHQNIQDCCYEAGIEIMSPHVHAMRDGNAAAMPPDYLPDGYEAPSFRVEQTGGTKK